MADFMTIEAVDRLTRRNPLPVELARFDFDPANPYEAFKKVLAYVDDLLGKAASEGKPLEIVVLSPFLYARYVEEFIEFVNVLRKKYPGLKVMVVTRKPEHVNNRSVHVRLVKMLQKAGIIVKMKALKTRDGREVPWHGKMVIVGADYVIAGSINPLAPSRFETPHVERLVKIVRNPGTWRTLRKLLVEDEEKSREKNVKNVKNIAIPVSAPRPRSAEPMWRRAFLKAKEHETVMRAIRRRLEEEEGVLLYA